MTVVRWLVVLVWCVGVAAQANDCRVVGLGGRVARVTGEQTSVRMVREWVKLEVYPRYYDVAVQFVFRNDGPATTVLMGFPETGMGDVLFTRYRDHSGFLTFQTFVDGREVTAARQRAQATGGETGYDTYWVKSVAFAKGQTRTVRVAYRSIPSDNSLGTRFVGYQFTGGNWKGTVAETALTVNMHFDGDYAIRTETLMTRQGNRFAARWTDWQAEDTFELEYMPVPPVNAMSLRWDGVHEGWSWICPRISLIHFDEKGAVDTWSRWAPPVIVAGARDTPCLALAALRDYLNAQSRSGATSGFPARLNWDQQRRAATLIYLDRTLTVTEAQATLRVDPGGEVALPTPAFMSDPVRLFNDWSSYLYVPAEQAVQALGGTVTADVQQRALTLHFPPLPKPGAPETLTIYRYGRYTTRTLAALRAVEEPAVAHGQQPWRHGPLAVAQVDTIELLPETARAAARDARRWDEGRIDAHDALVLSDLPEKEGVAYVLVLQEEQEATVDLRLHGNDVVYHLTLRRPFGHWWYVTKVALE